MALVVAVIAGVVAFALTRDGEPKTVTVAYSVEVFVDNYCDDFGTTGFDDIPFAQVEVIDGDGTFLGSGVLDGGSDRSDSCLFSAVFEVKPSTDGVYRVTAGNNNRGYLNYGEEDVVNGRLIVEATLG